MIKLRIDVDYPYPSRLRSFLLTGLKIHSNNNYLNNSKIIAKMINESPEKIRAYWFFTPQTIPDREMLDLMYKEKHEVALHVATDPYLEWKRLEKATGRIVKHYTVHGTARLLARLLWRRKIWEARASIPTGFPLKSFYDYPTLGLDRLCYNNPTSEASKIANQRIVNGEILHIHPEWLFQRGTLNHRGPFYETLKIILKVDTDLELLSIRKRVFARVAKYPEQYEYLCDVLPSNKFLEKLVERKVDIFTFIERKWCCPLHSLPEDWLKTEDNAALLQICPYEEWLAKVGKKTRNMIRKAEKIGVQTQVVSPSEKLAEGICKIFNETPIRQGREFSHFGWTPQDVKNVLFATPSSTFIGAHIDEELVGFVQLVCGDQLAVMAQILSMQKHWDKAVNNALVAKAVEVCAARGTPWLMYGRMGNHPSLDTFKESNGFSKFSLTRYFVPLTRKGRIAARLGLHEEMKNALPKPLRGALIPLFNWVSRTKVQVRRKLL